MADETLESIVLRSSNSTHYYKIYVRDDGLLAAAKLTKNNKGELVGQGEKVLVAWAADGRVW
jgi:hypothetical protein